MPTIQPKPTRALYVKNVPAEIWEQIHVNAIRSGMRLQDYVVSIFANAGPVPRSVSLPAGAASVSTKRGENATILRPPIE